VPFGQPAGITPGGWFSVLQPSAPADEERRDGVYFVAGTDVLVTAQSAPCRDVCGGRGIVGHDADDAADLDLADPPGQLDYRQRAAQAPAVEDEVGSHD
jgi:hypothetical protein